MIGAGIHSFASLPISIVGANSVMLGTLLSAAEYDGWIAWGHEASVVMMAPIAYWIACAWWGAKRRCRGVDDRASRRGPDQGEQRPETRESNRFFSHQGDGRSDP